ncbi:hypothetical protein [Paenibacillus aestuarii]|uniref:Uncharacterized protein n=1 Tax=Paenibacillus aestuarii TaxID=516965 RepID=A0ABW0KC28_9BACL|nr:hypothetical protein [Paenibacillus aestuarii]
MHTGKSKTAAGASGACGFFVFMGSAVMLISHSDNHLLTSFAAPGRNEQMIVSAPGYGHVT